MKSLILKDLYNIGHYAKSMLFILLVLAAAFFLLPALRDTSVPAVF